MSYTYNENNRLVNTLENMYNDGSELVAAKETTTTYDLNGNQIWTTSGVYLPDGSDAGALFIGELSDMAGGGSSAGGGNPASGDVNMTRSEYDGFNRLVKMTVMKDGGSLESSAQSETRFVYNGDGLRMSKTVKQDGNEQTTNYLYVSENSDFIAFVMSS